MKYIILCTGVALLFSLASSIECGDIIQTNTVLDHDLVCECDNLNPLGPGLGVGLLVVGPAILDLGGYSVSCSQMGTIQAPNICISPAESGATILNGHVSNCIIGVGGFGWFSNVTIKSVQASGTSVGFYLADANNNKILNVSDNGGAILVQGDNNLVKDNNVVNSLFESIYVTGDNNRVVNNTIENNLYADSDVAGTAALLVQPCDSCPCKTCADEWPGPDYYPQNNVIENNVIRNSAGSAMMVFSNDTYIRGNKVYNVTNGTGLLVGFSGNHIVDNFFRNVSIDGIRVTRGSMRIVSNSIHLTGDDGIDIASAAFNCVVKGNQIDNCIDNGINVRSSNHVLLENEIQKCDTGIQVLAEADRTKLLFNQVSDCKSIELYDGSEQCKENNWWLCNQGSGNYACTETGGLICKLKKYDKYFDANDWKSK